MGGRFYLTGTQLGLLLSMNKYKEFDDQWDLLINIMDNQFIGNKNDFEKLFKLFGEVLE